MNNLFRFLKTVQGNARALYCDSGICAKYSDNADKLMRSVAERQVKQMTNSELLLLRDSANALLAIVNREYDYRPYSMDGDIPVRENIGMPENRVMTNEHIADIMG